MLGWWPYLALVAALAFSVCLIVFVCRFVGGFFLGLLFLAALSFIGYLVVLAIERGSFVEAGLGVAGCLVVIWVAIDSAD